MLWILLMGYGAYRYHFVLPRGEDGKLIVPAAGTVPERPRFEYDHAEELRRQAELDAARRDMWAARLERLAAKGMSDEDLAIEREVAERSMAETEAAWRQLRARSRRDIWGEAARAPEPEPGPVESKRAGIQRLREKRAASWARWLASFEGDPERLAQERAWIERREADERAREDLGLAELESTMLRRAGVAGGQRARPRVTDRLLCRECGAAVRVPEARFVGPAILCAACEGALAPCPAPDCSGRLMEIAAGPGAGEWQCQECGRAYSPSEIPGSNVIQFPAPCVHSGP